MYVRSWNQVRRYDLGKDSSGVFSRIRATGTIQHTAKKYPMGTKAVALGVIIVLMLGIVLPFVGSVFGCGFTMFAVSCTSGSFASQGGALFVQTLLVILFVYVVIWVYHRT